MKSPKLALTTILLLPLTLFSVASNNLAHAEAIGLSISPPVIEILMKPNTSVIQAFTVKNQGETTQIVPRIATIKPTDSFGHSSFDIDTSILNSPLTLTLENANYALNQPLTIRAGESIQLVLKISSDIIAEPEDSYLALVLDVSSSQFANTQLTGSLSALILTTTTQTTSLPIDLEITSVSLPHLHDSLSPLIIEPIATNNSAHMIRPKGKMTITNWRGHQVYEQELYPHLILQESSRTLQAIRHNSDENINDTTAIPLSWQPSNLDIGPFQVTLTLTSQNDDLLAETSQTIWILPLQLTIYLLVAIILLVTLRIYRNPSQ